MTVKVSDILRLDSFREARVITMGRGGDNAVTDVTVADAPLSEADTALFRHGTFFISSFYLAAEKKMDLAVSVRLLCRWGASGLCIVDEFYDTLPWELRRACEENSFPVLIVKKEVPYSSMIREIMQLIFLDTQDTIMESRVDMLEKSDEEGRRLLLRQINPHLLNCVSAFYVTVQGDTDARIACLARMKELFSRSVTNTGMKYRGGVLGLVSYRETAENAVDEKLNYYVEQLRVVCGPAAAARAGLSENGLQLLQCRQAVSQAFNACRLERGLGRPEKDWMQVIRYRELGVYKILLPLRDSKETVDFCREILDPIFHFDAESHGELFRTMVVFTESGRSYRNTAEHLYIHENTVRHRIGRVRDLIGEANPAEDFCELFSIAYKIWKMNNME